MEQMVSVYERPYLVVMRGLGISAEEDGKLSFGGIWIDRYGKVNVHAG
jgi:hypothetical protein